MAQRLQIKSRNEDYPNISDDYDKQLKLALAERDRFLSDHPDYIPYQKEIDHILSRAGTTEDRMVVLAVMMEAKLDELTHHFQDLSEMVTAQLAQHHWG